MRQDLKDIQNHPDLTWATPGHPAYEYLIGQPQPPRHDLLWYGAFLSRAPLSASQAQARPIVSSNGDSRSPGSGKTFLLLHLISVEIVERALAIAVNGQDINSLLLITSTNNQAVENVQELLVEQALSQPLILPGGNFNQIDRQTIPTLQAKIDWLRSTSFERDEWASAQQELLSLVQMMRDLEADYRREQQEEPEIRQQLQVGEDDMFQLQALQEIQNQLQQEQRCLDEFAVYGHFPLEAYYQVQFQVDQALNWLSLSRDFHLPWKWLQQILEWCHGVWNRFQGITERRIVLRLAEPTESAISDSRQTPFPITIPSSRHQLI